MNHRRPMPRWLRLAAIATATIVLCSCQGPAGSRDLLRGSSDGLVELNPPHRPAPQSKDASARPRKSKYDKQVAPVAYEYAGSPPMAMGRANLPQTAWTGAPGDGYTVPGPLQQGVSQPLYPVAGGAGGNCPMYPAQWMGPGGVNAQVPWAPPGVRRPWPYDEYLFDGGDQNTTVVVDADWSVRGLDSEDTVAHYDTVDGRTLVTPSNRVPIYAPRFAAVRKVEGVSAHESQEMISQAAKPLQPVQQGDSRVATTAVQPLQPVGETGLKVAGTFRERLPGLAMENSQRAKGYHKGFMPYEDFQIIRLGIHDSGEKARLAQAVDAALVWSPKQAVQVVVDGQLAYEDKAQSKTEATFQYVLPPGKPVLRVVKVADKSEAQPGEIVEFTLRFDNLGDQTIGNVTLVDNLTTRLEYVPKSASCSLDADFFTQENDQESLVLRWEIKSPMKVGQGGLIRFKCRVR